MKKRTLNIAVTGLNAIDSPGPGVSVIRALHEAASFNVNIIGLSYESLEPGIYMHDLVARTYSIPYPAAGIDTLLARLEYIHEKEKIDVIIPNVDAELYPFIKLEPKLKAMGIHMFLPTLHQFEERHKVNLNDFGRKYGISVPHSKVLSDLNTVHSLPSEFSFPMIVKVKFYDASIAYSIEQVKSYFNKISAKWGLPIIIQEFVHGTEFNVTGLGDGKGNTIAAVPMRKQYITDKGKAWAGITIEDASFIDLAQKFIKATKWRGGCELEIMQSTDGVSYIMEVNPRFPAWIYLTAAAGQNQPAALVKMAFGEKIEPFKKYEVGKMFIRYAWDLITDVGEFQQISGTGEL